MADKPISQATMKLFTDLFRFILPDVNPATKESLAAGELGIDYNTGVFYFRDPYTLEVRSPNSVEAFRFINNRYNSSKDELTSDRVGGMKVYTDVTRLPDVNDINTVSIDTIISKMEQPAALYAHTVTDSYKTIGLPARDGLLSIIKNDTEAVSAQFYDMETTRSFYGQYDGATRQFLYWACDDDTNIIFAAATGNGTQQTVTVDREIEDVMVLTIRLSNDVQPTAIWSINDTDPTTLVTLYGDPVPSELLGQNSIIMLIRDELLNRWILADSSKSIMYQISQILSKRVTDATVTFVEKCGERIDTIENWLTSSAGKFTVETTVYNCTEDDTTVIPVSGLDIERDVLLVNYDQTILRLGIDYSISTDGASISLLNTTIGPNESLQFIVIKQDKFTS